MAQTEPGLTAGRDAAVEIAGTPVILISAQASARETAAALGLAGCIKKPLGMANLIPVIDRRVGSLHA